jgi:diaminopimelate epimerase
MELKDQRLPFYKMHGGGNDFVLLDHRERLIPEAEQPQFARRVCARQMGVGADGLILIENSASADFKWRFYNADGNQQIPLDEVSVTGHFVRVGVPHLVVPVDDLEAAPVTEWGRLIRFHEMFQPAGTNVNFGRFLGPKDIAIRTYERGVEDETLACGTGAVAAALVAAQLGKASSPVTVHTRGGEALTVYFQVQAGTFSEIYLEGDATVVFQGELWVDELK